MQQNDGTSGSVTGMDSSGLFGSGLVLTISFVSVTMCLAVLINVSSKDVTLGTCRPDWLRQNRYLSGQCSS